MGSLCPYLPSPPATEDKLGGVQWDHIPSWSFRSLSERWEEQAFRCIENAWGGEQGEGEEGPSPSDSLWGAHTPSLPPSLTIPQMLWGKECSGEGQSTTLKVILHVSTGKGPRAPCALAPSLDHNTGFIESCTLSLPRCTQSCGLAAPAHGAPKPHKTHPGKEARAS